MSKRIVLLNLIIIVCLLGSCNDTGMQRDGAENTYGKIAVIAGSIYDLIIWEKYPDSSVYYCNSPSDALLALKTGKADAYLDDDPLIRKAIADDEGFKILTPPICRNDYGIALNKSNTPLMDELNEFITEIKVNGVYDEMLNRWIEAEVPGVMPEISGASENGILRFGTTGDVDGFSFYKNGELAGFDVELAKRFAAHKGMGIEILIMDFGALVPAVSLGKIDFAAAVITITEERKETVGLTEPYFSLDGSLCVYDRVNVSADGSFIERVTNSFTRNLIMENRWKIILSGLFITMVISFFSFLIGTALGLVVCWMSMCKYRLLNAAGVVYMALLCSTPIVVLLMVIYYVVFAEVDINTIIVAIIAYALNQAAYISALFRRAVLSVGKGQIEAARGMGFSERGAFMAVTLPQAVRTALPAYKAELTLLIKSTSVVGYIAVIDLTKSADIIRSRTYDAFFPLLLVTLIYLMLTGVIVLVFEAINQLTDKRASGKWFDKIRRN